MRVLARGIPAMSGVPLRDNMGRWRTNGYLLVLWKDGVMSVDDTEVSKEAWCRQILHERLC
jgi:hypothetical protein